MTHRSGIGIVPILLQPIVQNVPSRLKYHQDALMRAHGLAMKGRKPWANQSGLVYLDMRIPARVVLVAGGSLEGTIKRRSVRNN